MSERMWEDMSERMSLQVKSGSELVFPMLFDHMSFATHRCWEINLKVAYARRYLLGKSISKVVWKPCTKILQCPKALAFYCHPCKLEELKNCQWAGSYNGKPRNDSQSANAAATMELVEQETGEDQDFIYIVRVGTGLHRCSKLYNMPRMTSCGIVWLRTWKNFKWTALTTTRTFMCSSRPITKATCTVDVLKCHGGDHSK